MPAIYILDVPEFRALADVARTRPECRVSEVGMGYLLVESDNEIVFDRRELGFLPAVWYGAFTGGITGRIAEFGRDTVRIVDDEGASL